MDKTKRFLWYQLPAILWLAAIFIQSSIPHLSAPDLGFKWIDKFAHFFIFAVLVLLLIRAFKNQSNVFLRQRRYLLTFLGGVIYGVL
ncbi:MAG: VanZ family protein, partial [bacterium]|nr:VanZ family protein [bacterium]